jgi:predicted MFS family arabinose efflux permease
VDVTLRLPRTAAFWVIGATLLAFMFASAAPSPLYVVYQADWGFSATTLTTVFAVYAMLLLLALVVVGGLSDHVGRRPVLAAALAGEVLGMALFAAADGVGWLLAARAVQGLATGAALGALSAALLDLAPGGNARLGSLVNSAAPTVGLASGALGSGLLVQLAPAPETLVFVLLLAAFALAVAGVAALPETSAQRPGAIASLRPRVGVPERMRPQFLVVLPCLLATWSVGGLYLSLGPSLAAGVLGLHSHLVGGLVIAVLMVAGTLGSVGLRDAPARPVMLAGAGVLATGIGVTLLALALTSAAMFFAGTAVAGFGFGAAFLGAFGTLAGRAQPGERAELFASVYTVSYLAFSVPAIAAGLAVGSYGLRATATVYGAAVIALCGTAMAGLLAQGALPKQAHTSP